MVPDVLVIGETCADFTSLLGHTQKMLGYNIASAVDSDRKQHNGLSRFASCLAAFRDRHAKAGITPDVARFLHVTFLVAADERDMLDIASAGGMPFLAAETIARGVLAAFIGGTLDQWQRAVVAGCNSPEQNVRVCFGKIMGKFTQMNLQLWTDYNVKPQPDQTFLLEHKRA